MLALWQYSWEEAEWVPSELFHGMLLALCWHDEPATPAPDDFFGLLLALRWDGTDAPVEPEPEPEVVAEGRSNAGGGGPLLYTGPDPDFWDVRERYLRRYEKVVSNVEPIAKSDFTPVVKGDNLIGSAGGMPGGPLAVLQMELAAQRQQARKAVDSAQLQQSMRQAAAIALDIRKIHQQYYDQAISILLLDVL